MKFPVYVDENYSLQLSCPMKSALTILAMIGVLEAKRLQRWIADFSVHVLAGLAFGCFLLFRWQ